MLILSLFCLRIYEAGEGNWNLFPDSYREETNHSGTSVSRFGIWSFFQLLCPAMKRHIHNARDLILPVIDFFYPPFRRIMNLQTFRYAASGGANTLLGFLVYFVSYEFILRKKELQLLFYAFKPHSAALFISFCVTLPIGFFMSKYVVFSDSKMKGRIQLFRYFMICLFNLALNFILLKILVEQAHIYAVLAQLLTTSIVILFSYLAQRHFSFKADEDENETTG
jgi:putative flippase GtrA